MISIKIPKDIIKNLSLKAHESGHSLQYEVEIRLLASLQRETLQQEEDSRLANYVIEHGGVVC